jgi:hypothetical protein
MSSSPDHVNPMPSYKIYSRKISSIGDGENDCRRFLRGSLTSGSIEALKELPDSQLWNGTINSKHQRNERKNEIIVGS